MNARGRGDDRRVESAEERVSRSRDRLRKAAFALNRLSVERGDEEGGDRRTQVRLQEVAASKRAPLLKAWYGFTSLSANPRRHFKLGRSAAIEEFERIAANHPVFRLSPTSCSG